MITNGIEAYKGITSSWWWSIEFNFLNEAAKILPFAFEQVVLIRKAVNLEWVLIT